MTRGQSEFRDDYAHLRVLFTLVPWRMRRQVLELAVSAALTALLDMVAVTAMLPLTQLLMANGAVPPMVERLIVPVAGTRDPQRLIVIMAVLMITAFVAKNVLTIVIRWWSLGVVQRAASAAQAEMLSRYMGSSYAQHRGRSKADVLQVVTAAIPQSFTLVLLGYIAIAVDGLTMAVLVVTILWLSPTASLSAVLLFGAVALVLARVVKPLALRYAVRSLDLGTESWRFINPAVEGFREARIFGRESLFVEGYRRNRAEVAGYAQRGTLLGELPKYVLEVVMVVGVFLVAVLLFATTDTSTALGLLAVFAAASVRLIPALNRTLATFNGVRSGRVSLAKVVEEADALARDAVSQRGYGEQVVDLPRQDIVVRDVSFRYPDADRDVLTGVTVTIRRGSTVALVGSSGAGKTTFADILVGLLEPTSGAITIGGVSLADHPASWRSEVAMVSQRVYMWEAPLRDLITFGVPHEEVDRDLLQDVIRRARLDTVVASLPEGLDTWIGEGGARLSGGQVQRVGIARALYAEPSVLVLDEATSALDNETEHEITATIEALHGQITVIVIAHRLSTVKNADEILFFSEGRLKAQGSMSELRRREPEFERLVQLGSLTLD